MTRVQGIVASGIVLVGLLLAIWLCVLRYGSVQRAAGYADAISDGKAARDSAATSALAIESGLRSQLLERDTTTLRKEQEHAFNLEAAQRRVRTGVDSLRCPAGPVPAGATADDRPAATTAAVDRSRPAIVPEDAAAILGDGADIARIVRQYDQIIERFEACRAVNSM